MPVTVVINNRNLVTWPRAMVACIEKFRGLAEILIVDNGSTYEPLLEWYGTLSHTILYEDNGGHSAPWEASVNARIKTDFYVVTDPDLDLSGIPADVLEHLQRCLTRFPQAGKIGLGLDIEAVPAASPYYAHVNTYERRLWQLPLIDNLVRAAPVDTTFAIYNKKLMNRYLVCGGRTDHPYVAKHIPWSVVERSEEFIFYLKTANTSSSYKSFLKLNI